MLTYGPVHEVLEMGISVSQVFLDGEHFADVEKVQAHEDVPEHYLVHRNGIVTLPFNREDVKSILDLTAQAVLQQRADQQAAEATDGFGAISVTDLINGEFGDSMNLF